MRFYGFNPFIQAYHDEKRGVIYDLLEGDIFEVPSEIVKIFTGSRYKSFKEIKEIALKFKISEKELKKMLKEGKERTLILELNRPYWRNEIKAPIEAQALRGETPFFYSTIVLQPTGICDGNCSFCNSFINCCCFGKKREWNKEELANLLRDLKRFEGMIEKIEIFGGNPLLYSEIENLLTNLNKIKPKLININIPIASFSCEKEKILRLNKICKSKFRITFLAFSAYKDISSTLSLIEKNYRGSRVKLFFDQETGLKQVEDIKNGSGFSVELLLRKDLSNLEWYREKTRNRFLEGAHIFDFYLRKHFHRCWGNSFSVDCEGNVKPCLWSDIIFGHWKGGKIINILDDLNAGESFGMANSLGRIEGCKDCIYRIGCKDCRVIAEFLTGRRKTKNPLCEKQSSIV